MINLNRYFDKRGNFIVYKDMCRTYSNKITKGLSCTPKQLRYLQTIVYVHAIAIEVPEERSVMSDLLAILSTAIKDGALPIRKKSAGYAYIKDGCMLMPYTYNEEVNISLEYDIISKRSAHKANTLYLLGTQEFDNLADQEDDEEYDEAYDEAATTEYFLNHYNDLDGDEDTDETADEDTVFQKSSGMKVAKSTKTTKPVKVEVIETCFGTFNVAEDAFDNFLEDDDPVPSKKVVASTKEEVSNDLDFWLDL